MGKRAGCRFVTFHFTVRPVFGRRGGVPPGDLWGRLVQHSQSGFLHAAFSLTCHVLHAVGIVSGAKCTVCRLKVLCGVSERV